MSKSKLFFTEQWKMIISFVMLLAFLIYNTILVSAKIDNKFSNLDTKYPSKDAFKIVCDQMKEINHKLDRIIERDY